VVPQLMISCVHMHQLSTVQGIGNALPACWLRTRLPHAATPLTRAPPLLPCRSCRAVTPLQGG
jgi:hypothetical protein